MKKLFFCVITVFTFLGNAKAQYVFDKGDLAVNAVLGLAGADGLIPSIEFSGEYGVIPTGSIGIVSFGGKIGYKYSNGVNGIGINPGYDYNYSQFDVGARAAWHLLYFENTKWDVFAGLGVGLNYRSGYSYDYYTIFGVTGTDKVKGSSHLYSAGFVGGRMMLSDNFGLYGELGYSRMSTVRIGLTFKL